MKIFLFLVNSIALGAGLAMDAFSVSIANALDDPVMSKKRRLLIATTFGGFQFLMPMAGWICVHTIVNLFQSFQKCIPWIALLLLSYIGGKTLLEGIRHHQEGYIPKGRLSGKELFLQGVATSIDALSVGFTIANYQAFSAFLVSLIVAAVTFLICLLGLAIGKRAGLKLQAKASILGGLLLLAIGIEIFLGGVF